MPIDRFMCSQTAKLMENNWSAAHSPVYVSTLLALALT